MAHRDVTGPDPPEWFDPEGWKPEWCEPVW